MKKLITIYAVTAVLALLCMGGSPAFAEWTVVSLHPNNSSASGVSGGQQVGCVPGPPASNNYNHACLWSGTAESCVDINPAVATWSSALGVSGGQQVGFAHLAIGYHASLWSGTAASWVDIHPAGAGPSSAYGVSGGQQVGFARVGGVMHASLWNGTAESWVDLNPAGAQYSYGYGVSGGWQVGYAGFGELFTVFRAVLWNGTAESWVDLHAILPANYRPVGAPGGQSQATSVDVSAGEIWVVGWAFNSSTCRNEAILWHYTAEPVPEPAPTPVEQILQILDFTEDSVTDGTLEGVGPGKSADKKLRALVNMLEFAGYLIISENYDIACDQLTAALAKCDGQSPPPDFVEGDAAENLAVMIQELKTELCEML